MLIDDFARNELIFLLGILELSSDLRCKSYIKQVFQSELLKLCVCVLFLEIERNNIVCIGWSYFIFDILVETVLICFGK